MTWLQTGLSIVAGLALYELVRFFVVRRVRSRLREGAVRFVRQHRIQLESASFIDRVWIREALAQDPAIEQVVARQSREGGESPQVLRARVDTYAEEIAPFFSLAAYYRLGSSVAKRIIDFLFEMVVEPGGFEEQASHAPPEAVRVYVINHRANIDPAILAYGLLRHVPMSYAVGEWALVWPLHTLFRLFGSYFVRRGEKDPLYHKVLERFIQLIASQGAVTGFFIEGGLSRDGALRRPRTGLLDYIIGLRHDHPDREIVFMPVGLNYDRVFEDRILTRDNDGPLPKPTRTERLLNVLGVLFWIPQLVVANLFKLALRSHRKFGYAAVEFGEPLRLCDWPGGATVHQLPDEERREALCALGEELLYHRIAEVVPATPVPILCEALLRDGPPDRKSIRERVRLVIAELRAAKAPLAFGADFASVRSQRSTELERPAIHEAFDLALIDDEEAELVTRTAALSLRRRRVLRTCVTPTGDGLEAIGDSEVLLRYYANSIAHHLQPRDDAPVLGEE